MFELLEKNPYGRDLLSKMYRCKYELLKVDFLGLTRSVSSLQSRETISTCTLTFKDPEQRIWTMKGFDFMADHASEDMLPMLGGVYRFMRGDECLYIGKSISLRSRIKHHFGKSKKHNPLRTMLDEVTDVQYCTMCDADMHVTESLLIAHFRPVLNKESVPLNRTSFLLPKVDFKSMVEWADLRRL